MLGGPIVCLILRFSLRHLTSWQGELYGVDGRVDKWKWGGGGGGTITRCNTGGLKVKDLAGENIKVEQGRSFCILSNTRFLSGERSKTRKKWEVGVRGGGMPSRASALSERK